MDAWLKERQTDGKSQVIREAVMARMIAERDGDWEAPEVPDEPPAWLRPDLAVADGGGQSDG